ncbi:integrin alpha-M-like [Hemicordylus capensis]|uniref:integrin alpha-M-like n=1 Tax=Hemicordylus capensis TaxID=884348 RepID=UPI0023036834|nr:integrin alpha-M-like [Hemicordylus capensis]
MADVFAHGPLLSSEGSPKCQLLTSQVRSFFLLLPFFSTFLPNCPQLLLSQHSTHPLATVPSNHCLDSPSDISHISLHQEVVPRFLRPCYGFSVDTEQPFIFQETAEGFGQTVVPLGSGRNARVLVGAPLQRGDVNETGKLYSCQQLPGKSGRCQEVNLQRPNDAVNMSLGLSVSVRGSEMLVCGPTVHQTCGGNMYMKGYCFLLDQNLKEIQHFPESLPVCADQTADIVFLIDGSGSILPPQFIQMKTFISKIMESFHNTKIQFALVQYGTSYREHFDFIQYKNTPNSNTLIEDVVQLGGFTYTATSIQKVVRGLFIQQRGSRNGASKILIVITDGEKTGDRLQYSDVMPEVENAGIIRFAIGVGNAFSNENARQELSIIASAPSSDYVFRVDNFSDLNKDLQNQLKDKIFSIEGTQSQNSTSFQLEMSQEGFSALLTPDGSMLGAVGVYDWSGGLFLYGSSGEPSFINVSTSSKDMNDAYLGYSTQMVQRNGQRSYVVGAPRYQHAGKVFLFREQREQWQLIAELKLQKTPQIGSYFGATLCSVDLDGDSSTDLVLVGAPLYYDRMAGGRVYIFQWQGEKFLYHKELQGETKYPLGRFGASIAEIGEITGDQWTDVAIGAPLEDEHRGAVYIFQGSSSSINQKYSQRIQGSRFVSRPHYFGQAIGAGMDLTADGLPDIVAGASGQVLLLRSRPVLQVESTITFTPAVIPISAFECQGQEVLNKNVSMARVCLRIRTDPRFTLGDSISSIIRYTLLLDPDRVKVRATFGTGSSIITDEMQMGVEIKCKEYRIHLPSCTGDSVMPIKLQLNYTLMGHPIPAADNLRAILSKDGPSGSIALLPFEKNCGGDGKCEDKLNTTFSFSGLEALVVGLTTELNITVFIQNDGEDSYSTTLTFSSPSALSYRKVTPLQFNTMYMTIQCTSTSASKEDPVRNIDTTCIINPPIFRSGTKVIFNVTFSVPENADLGSMLQIKAIAGSESNGTITPDMVHQEKLPVKYAVYIFVNKMDESTKYVSFSTGEEDGSQLVEHWYEVKNTYRRSIPVSVTFQFPVKLDGTRIWNASLEFRPELAQCVSGRETPGSKDFVKQLKEHPTLNCSVAACQIVHCNISSLELKKPLEFTIKGNISFKWLSQTQQKKVILASSAHISYNETKYTQKVVRVQSQAETVLEHLEPYNALPVILGSSIGGLVLLALIAAGLYKLGFFKRQYKQMADEASAGGTEGAAPPQGSCPDPSQDATKG